MNFLINTITCILSWVLLLIGMGLWGMCEDISVFGKCGDNENLGKAGIIITIIGIVLISLNCIYICCWYSMIHPNSITLSDLIDVH